VCGQWEPAGGVSAANRAARGRETESEVPLTVSTGGHRGTHVVAGGSLRRVFDFRSTGRWVACHKLQDDDTFVGVCDSQSLCCPDPSPWRRVLECAYCCVARVVLTGGWCLIAGMCFPRALTLWLCRGLRVRESVRDHPPKIC